MLRVGAQIDEGLSREKQRVPFDGITVSALRGMCADHVDSPEVTPVYVAAIRIEKDHKAVGRERPLLDFAVARSEKVDWATIGQQFEYRCCQPSSSLAITRRLSAAQLRTPPPVSSAM